MARARYVTRYHPQLRFVPRRVRTDHMAPGRLYPFLILVVILGILALYAYLTGAPGWR